MKTKLILLTAIMTLSFSVLTEAAIFVETEQVADITSSSEIVQTNLSDIPFIHLLESTFPFFYPPLDMLNEEPVTYTVEEGDNLFRIAVNHGMTLQELVSMNKLSGEIIYPGDILTISDDGAKNDLATITSVQVAADISENNSEMDSNTPVFNTSITSPPTSSGLELTVTATAYTAYCTGCSGTTAYGIDLRSNPDQKVIAVDPSIIPLGTKVWVEGYGEAIAGDVGSAIKGHKIDVFIPSYENAMEWGVKKVKLKVIN